MMKRLVYVDSALDRLWFDFARQTFAGHPDTVILDGREQCAARSWPHRADLCGWRAWLRQNAIGFFEYFPADNLPPALAAACEWRQVNLNVHFTGYPDHGAIARARRIAPAVTAFVCYDSYTHKHLPAVGFDSRRLILRPFHLDAAPHRSLDRAELLAAAGISAVPESTFLLLSLHEPCRRSQLHFDIHVAAMLRHLYPHVFLVMAGPLGDNDRILIQERLASWKVDNLILWTRQCYDWQSLASACDAVIAGPAPLSDIARYHTLLSLDLPIAAPDLFFQRYGMPPAPLRAPHPEPRALAALIVQKLLERSLLAAL